MSNTQLAFTFTWNHRPFLLALGRVQVAIAAYEYTQGHARS